MNKYCHKYVGLDGKIEIKFPCDGGCKQNYLIVPERNREMYYLIYYGHTTLKKGKIQGVYVLACITNQNKNTIFCHRAFTHVKDLKPFSQM